jgi:NADH-quinone oxidoreductase subunit G
MLQAPLRAYILFGGVEPEADSLSPDSMKALAAADLVIAVTPYMTEQLKQIAHVVLPIGTFAETSGTYVNLEGVWQSFTAAARSHGESRPGWKVLRVLGTELGIAQFEYQTSEQVRDELRTICAEGLPPAWVGSRAVSGAATAANTVDVPMYQVDAVVRRAPSLQRTVEGRSAPATY